MNLWCSSTCELKLLNHSSVHRAVNFLRKDYYMDWTLILCAWISRDCYSEHGEDQVGLVLVLLNTSKLTASSYIASVKSVVKVCYVLKQWKLFLGDCIKGNREYWRSPRSYWKFWSGCCRTTVIFEITLKDRSILINTLALNNCFNNRKHLQNKVDALLKIFDTPQPLIVCKKVGFQINIYQIMLKFCSYCYCCHIMNYSIKTSTTYTKCSRSFACIHCWNSLINTVTIRWSNLDKSDDSNYTKFWPLWGRVVCYICRKNCWHMLDAIWNILIFLQMKQLNNES